MHNCRPTIDFYPCVFSDVFSFSFTGLLLGLQYSIRKVCIEHCQWQSFSRSTDVTSA